MGEENQIITDMVRAAYNLPEQDIKTYSPLALAYIGDAIYDLVIRTMLIMRGNSQVNKLHKRASNFVKAAAQKQIMEVLEPLLTPQEHSYYKRGRNAKSFTTAKNASIVEYRVATGFEALLGFLYLTGQMDRLMELVKVGTNALTQIETVQTKSGEQKKVSGKKDMEEGGATNEV